MTTLSDIEAPAAETAGPRARNGAAQRLHFRDIAEPGDEPCVVWKLHRELGDPQILAHLTIDGEPVSKSRARFTNRGSKSRTYTPEKTKQAEQNVAAHFRRTVPGWRPHGLHGFGVMAVFFTESFQRRDVDNMIKLILDACNKVVWEDDVQVTEVSGRVVRGVDEPRTEIAIYITPSSARPTKPCENCGKPFEVYKSQGSRRFCDRGCGTAWRKAQRRRTCPVCGDDFFPKPSQRDAHCSRDCADKATRVMVPCAHCGTEYSTPQSIARRRGNNYCSDDCKAAFWRDRRTSRAGGTCSVCGGATSKKAYRRCNPCKQSGREVVTGLEPGEDPLTGVAR
jgi:Holliday junction resolvase RusA-like endonuclease